MEEAIKLFEGGEWKGEGKFPAELSAAENDYYQSQAQILSAKHGGGKIHPVVQLDAESRERYVCYVKEPSYLQKLASMDKSRAIGAYQAAEELRSACVIKDASDSITYSESPESDAYKLGIADFCIGLVLLQMNHYKKK